MPSQLSSSSNALSDQPESVRGLLKAQVEAAFASAAAARPSSNTRDVSGRSSVFGSTEIQGLLNALVDAIRLGLRREIADVRDRGDMGKPTVLGPGAVDYFPTWSFWGTTRVRLHNTGPIPVTVLINDDRFQLEPDQQTTKEGKWAAFPVRVINSNESVGSEVTVTVT